MPVSRKTTTPTPDPTPTPEPTVEEPVAVVEPTGALAELEREPVAVSDGPVVDRRGRCAVCGGVADHVHKEAQPTAAAVAGITADMTVTPADG